ncbi:unnamed protein product [Ambrosiozyma monospora]|uniref:Unnamed protein product n=1 Tax=Ambrosiozyma monospora TaxID=43982 RepID=A0A9W6YSU5_AMBMO|nr:unnamed protein product [Ambrosiozyma monospora]
MDYIQVTKVEGVTLHKRGKSITGTLHLTTHHLIFTLPPQPLPQHQQSQNQNGGQSGNGTQAQVQVQTASRELWVCYPIIEKIELNKGSAMIFLPHRTQAEVSNTKINLMLQGGNLRVKCRDFNYLAFDFDDLATCISVYESIMKLTCIDDLRQLYAFNYMPIKIEAVFNSWFDYDVVREFSRQGLDLNSEDNANSNGLERSPGFDKWRVTNLNKNYKLCATYPSQLIVPKSISDNNLVHTVKFRSKNRFPALCYYYKANGSTITRCSQPLVGLKQNRSYQDERLLSEIFKTNGHYGGLNIMNVIVDARPVKNAIAQHAIGGGNH